MSLFANHWTTGFSRAASLAVAALVSGVGLMSHPAPARGADIEVFFIPTEERPKASVLFIVDTSQSMFTATERTEEPYDPARTYSGSWNSDRYYWVAGSNLPISNGNMLSDARFLCPNLKAEVNREGFVTPGIDVAQQVTSRGNTYFVPLAENITPTSQSDKPVYCNGDGTLPSGLSFQPPGTYRSNYTFYDGNYLNYKSNPPTTGDDGPPRIDVMLETLVKVVENTNGIRVGLMRLDSDGDTANEIEADCSVTTVDVEGTHGGDGGMIVYPATDIDLPGVKEEIRYLSGIDIGTWDGATPEAIATGAGPWSSGKMVDTIVTDPLDNPCWTRLFSPSGRAPLAGAFAESLRYFTGDQVWTGSRGNVDAKHKFDSVAESVASTRGAGAYDPDDTADHCPLSQIQQCYYRSPMKGQTCSAPKSYIIMITDGTTEQEGNSDASIANLIGGSCGVNAADQAILNVTRPFGYQGEDALENPSMCVNDLARYLETQLVKTFTVGFQLGSGPAADAAQRLLEDTASFRDDGQKGYYTADTAEELELALNAALREALVDAASFTAPAVTVNAFNRTQNLNDLYLSVFQPANSYRWKGNIKKYAVDPVSGQIVDRMNVPAVGPDGAFKKTAQSFWHTGTDGNTVTSGGAATELPAHGDRRIFTDLASDTITSAGNHLSQVAQHPDAALLTGLNLTPGLDPAVYTPADLVDWALGKDVSDRGRPAQTTPPSDPALGPNAPNGIEDETRLDMGDPVHARPATVVYGGSASQPDPNDAVVYVVTNDGMLHAIDAQTGSELWAYMPLKFVQQLGQRFVNANGWQTRGYGLDGSIRDVRIDRNGNGFVEPSDGDRVLLYFGERRGGRDYYAIDVTNRNSPQLLWNKGPADYPGIGQTWSSPQPARVRLEGETVPRLVLVFGGGYSDLHDAPGFYGDDFFGNAVYMVDAFTGDLIWRAAPACDIGDACLELPEMRFAIPADVRVLDLNGDSLADRMYAADLGGRIWRFDIFNGNAPTGNTEDPANGTTTRLVEGGILASIGAAEDTTPADADKRKFYFAPDPSLLRIGTSTVINIAAGSGNREMPISDTVTNDGIFSIRDYKVFGPLFSSQYKQDCTGETGPCHQWVTESDDDLVDLTTVADSTAIVGLEKDGWKIWLNDDEKVLAETRTFEGAIFATTYTPQITDQCTFGQAALYVMRALDARPVNVYQNDKPLGDTPEERVTLLNQQTIPPEVTFIFPSPTQVNCLGQGCRPQPICLVGPEGCGSGFNNQPVRSFWRQRGAE